MNDENKQSSEVGDGMTCAACGHVHKNDDGSCACGCTELQKK